MYTKRIKTSIYLVLALLFSGFISCTKQLDTTPENTITELRTFNDARLALGGAYDGFQTNSYYNNPAASGTASAFSALPDLMGDDFVEAFESLGNWNSMSEMIYAADNPVPANTFFQAYDIISRTNNLLAFLPQFETGETAAEAQIIKAQALAIRAHVHFDLMRYFAQDFARNSTLLGIPYITTFDPQNPFKNLPARGTVKDNYDAIFKDLSDALTAFSEGGNTPDNDSRYLIDSTVVHAMWARVSYYASQWQDVITETSLALNDLPLGNAEDFVASFVADEEAAPPTEVYWQIPSDNLLRPGGAIAGGSPNYRITALMTAELRAQDGAYTDPNIVRFNQVGAGGIQRTLLRKYAGLRSFKVFRAGEMQLMRAEARYRSGDAGGALDDLNELRVNRDVATGTETGTALLDAILMQRRVELLGEGHRWFDIRRTTKTILRAECGTAGGSRAANCNIQPSARGWTFPIPFNELKVNPNLVQNPGY